MDAGTRAVLDRIEMKLEHLDGRIQALGFKAGVADDANRRLIEDLREIQERARHGISSRDHIFAELLALDTTGGE